MEPKVSVIIPNYNYSRFLEDRIESVLGQTFQDFEVILLDDCSTDDSVSVLDRYRSHPKVAAVVVNEENSGSPFQQWEKGLAMARGKYIWIAEADDFATDRFLERTVEAIESDEDVTLVKTMSELIDENGVKGAREYFEEYEPDGRIRIYDGNEFLRENMLRWNYCYNASMMLFRRDAWAALTEKPYLKMRYVGDWLFWGMLMAGHKIGDVSERLSSFRFHGHSVTDEAYTCSQSDAEVQIVLARFLDMLPADSSGKKFFMRYQFDKLLRRDKFSCIRTEIQRIDPDFGRRFKLSALKYPFYWIYKHLIWSVPGKASKREGMPRPLSIIEPHT